MKRTLNLFLGALAAGMAVGVLTRRQPATEAVSGTGTTDGQIGASLAQDDSSLRAHARLLTHRMAEHHTLMIAASLAYYAMLALFPMAIAGISIYGLVFNPADVERQIAELSEALPSEVAMVISGQIKSIVNTSATGLGIATVIGIALALFTASAGTRSLITGINIAYGEKETRNFAVLRGLAMLLTIGLIVFASAAVALVTFLPALLDNVDGSGWERIVTYGRWPTIFLAVIFGLGVFYKLAPNRPRSRTPLLSIGAATGATLWLLVTVGLSVYVTNLGSFNETYGTLGGVIVLMLWFWLSGLAILLGAEFNDELEERGLAHRRDRNRARSQR